MNHAVPFCHFPDFNVYNEENHVNKGCGTVSKFWLFFLQKADDGTMRYHLAVFAILRVETREQVMHESCGTISSFCQF